MSMTRGERRALAWLLAVIASGSGVKVIRHWRDRGDATAESAESLARQLLAVDSAQTASRTGRKRALRPRAKRLSMPADTGGSLDGAIVGGRRRRRSVSGADSAVVRAIPMVIDVDVADSAALEKLPRIGPALASRIVADRSANGPFGSLSGLERVRGIGPKMAASLAPLVTFSGNPRPSPVQR
jgi:DNA uptake protein ComE-like DNA-binding protein